MSMKNPIDLRQDRRQWLKTSASVLGASLVPLPAGSAEMPQAGTAAPSVAQPVAARSADRFLTPAQHALDAELSETMIPADSHSGGAKAAGVADFIDQVLRETTDDNQK